MARVKGGIKKEETFFVFFIIGDCHSNCWAFLAGLNMEMKHIQENLKKWMYNYFDGRSLVHYLLKKD